MIVLRITEGTVDIRLGTESAMLLSNACSLASEHRLAGEGTMREALYLAAALFELAAYAGKTFGTPDTGEELDYQPVIEALEAIMKDTPRPARVVRQPNDVTPVDDEAVVQAARG